MTIDIIVPTYGRPVQAYHLLQNIRENTSVSHFVHFVIEADQYVEYSYHFGDSIGDNWTFVANERSKNYAGAVNTALKFAHDDYVFLAADDVRFHRGWDVTALNTMEALPNVKVVGTNDLLNEYVLKGWHSTHYLIERSYLDDPGGVVDGARGHALYEGYSHNYTDTEFIGTAKARAVFAPCRTSIVEHLHWQAGKSPKDATSEKAYADYDEDTRLYDSRKHLWWDLSR